LNRSERGKVGPQAGASRWHYRCGPPRANRKETLDDADFATWWATEARALLLMA
jgi:hypothetical protein